MKINTVVANSGEWTIKVHTQPAQHFGGFFTCCSMSNSRGEIIRLKLRYSESEEQANWTHRSLCEKAKDLFDETS